MERRNPFCRSPGRTQVVAGGKWFTASSPLMLPRRSVPGPEIVLEAAGLRGASGGVVLRIEEQHQPPPQDRFRRMLITVLIFQVETGKPVTNPDGHRTKDVIVNPSEAPLASDGRMGWGVEGRFGTATGSAGCFACVGAEASGRDGGHGTSFDCSADSLLIVIPKPRVSIRRWSTSNWDASCSM